jgi:anti-sigma-K factor RskA
MTQKEKIQQEIEETLNSLNGLKRAEANPFLFTRIKARMNKRTGAWDRTFSFVSKPLVVLAVLVLVMAINGWSYFGNNTPTTDPLVDETVSLPEFENEYKLITSTDSYDYENVNNE